MASKIIRFIMRDGSRQFGELPETVDWAEFRDHIATLPGSKVTGYLTDQITEVWIDFTYKGHAFEVNNQYGDYWFFVKNPQCPEEILSEVLRHCEQVTSRETT